MSWYSNIQLEEFEEQPYFIPKSKKKVRKMKKDNIQKSKPKLKY